MSEEVIVGVLGVKEGLSLRDCEGLRHGVCTTLELSLVRVCLDVSLKGWADTRCRVRGAVYPSQANGSSGVVIEAGALRGWGGGGLMDEKRGGSCSLLREWSIRRYEGAK